ncbi:MAG: PadR family transcriptional regulator [Phycisphaerae bacterium]|nr:PadR family transcriptional regulator [Gemmatimonadaceae bacterium]
MRRHWFYILLSLAAHDRHGSGIMRDVLELTDGDLKLWPVTLYGSLDELVEEGWIKALEAAPSSAQTKSDRLRWFHITAEGRRVLATEVQRMNATVRVAEQRLAQVKQR